MGNFAGQDRQHDLARSVFVSAARHDGLLRPALDSVAVGLVGFQARPFLALLALLPLALGLFSGNPLAFSAGSEFRLFSAATLGCQLLFMLTLHAVALCLSPLFRLARGPGSRLLTFAI
ncbi:MAG TPA: hypothetical protein DHB48_10550 [Sphingobium sp.]|nr:hypothetical protein [Sphingobium sp.]